MQYKIIKNQDFHHFQEVVSDYLYDGWKPHGGLIVLPRDACGLITYIQALTKE